MVEVARDRREGRGRLSTLDMLPDDASADLVWALEALRAREMPANAILDEFNARLADRGVAKVSKSAFNRWSIRKTLAFNRLDEARAITKDIVATLGTSDTDELTIAIGEISKAAIYESLEQGEKSPKQIMELARALSAVVSAQKASAEHRGKLEARANAMVEDVVEKAGDVMREAGLSADRVAQMRRDVLGLRV
ncbi:MAG: phage protein Gp27 family protein [Pseudomonadota bacterium]